MPPSDITIVFKLLKLIQLIFRPGILPSTKAELFAHTFASNSTLDDSGAIPPPSTPSNSFMPNILISSKDVISSLCELNTKKAYGPDGIPNAVLKTCASELAPCLGKFFVYVFLPRPSLLAGNVRSFNLCPRRGTPLKSQHSNYRPISLTYILSKVFKSILNRNTVELQYSS